MTRQWRSRWWRSLMRLLIIGASGFLGGHVRRAGRRRGLRS